MRNLIPVDDRKIRKQAFSRVDRLLKKLQRMEANVESFYDRDQRLFHDWFELTFRTQKQRMSDLQTEYRDLAEFHNWMIALAQMEDLSLAEAAVRLSDERARYEVGTVEERWKIDEIRRLREEYIRAESEREHRRARRDANEEEPMRYSPPDDEDLEELALLAELPNDELENWVADPDIAFLLLGKTLRAAHYSNDYRLFFRIWDVLHPNIQRQFSRAFQKHRGESLEALIEEMREDKGESEIANAQNAHEFAEGSFAEETQAQPKERGQTAAEKEESLKLVYRQLARKLHPDMHVGDSRESADWRKGIWLRVQQAYQNKNSRELSKLFHLVLLRTRELNDLRLSELHLSHQWLEDEIAQTADSISNLRRQPAWGFSRRKDFAPVERKLERKLSKDMRALEDQVFELKSHHAFLVRMGRADSAGRRRRHRR